MTHPYIYQRSLERRVEDIRRAEQHRLARVAEPPAAPGPASAHVPEPVRWTLWTRLVAGWPFRPLPVGPIR